MEATYQLAGGTSEDAPSKVMTHWPLLGDYTVKAEDKRSELGSNAYTLSVTNNANAPLRVSLGDVKQLFVERPQPGRGTS